MADMTALQGCRDAAFRHAQRCRKAVSDCEPWSRAQGEWSRARDVAMQVFGDIKDIIDAENARVASQEDE